MGRRIAADGEHRGPPRRLERKDQRVGPATAILMLALTTLGYAAQNYEKPIPPEEPSIGYWADDAPDGVVGRRQELGRLASSDDAREALARILDVLEVPVSSQMLVFSKTSLQRGLISPRNPRAVYFNDELAVAFVPGSGLVELAAYQPRTGTRFYSMNWQTGRIERPPMCLECHAGAASLGIPGMYIGSVETSPSGRPQYANSIVSDPTTPFEQRWGGWYVTGAPTGFRHRGNAVTLDPTSAGLSPSDNLTSVGSVERFIDASKYATQSSDLTALMVFEHQSLVHNLATRLRWEYRLAANETRDDDRSLRLDALARALVFDEEAALPAPLPGDTPFVREFVERGPKDRKGRTLRRLNLNDRLFEYHLSYLVHTNAIESLPSELHASLFDRILHVLNERLGAGEITRTELQSVVEIAAEIVPNVPSEWRGLAER